jgi:hypothetical protein
MCPHVVEEINRFLIYKNTNPTLENSLSSVPSPNMTAVDIKVSTYEFGEKFQGSVFIT